MALTITEKQMGGITVLTLEGRIVLGEESNRLRETIKALVAAGKKRLLLDLGEVTHIDSAGLGTLVSSFSSTKNQSGEMKLANLTKKFRDQLHITKLVTVFDVYDSVELGLKSFA